MIHLMDIKFLLLVILCSTSQAAQLKRSDLESLSIKDKPEKSDVESTSDVPLQLEGDLLPALTTANSSSREARSLFDSLSRVGTAAFGGVIQTLVANKLGPPQIPPTVKVGSHQIMEALGIDDTQLRPCKFDDGYLDSDIGRVNLDPILYCDPRALRFLPGVTCCSPEPPAPDFPRFLLYEHDATSVTRLKQTILNWRDPQEVQKLPSDKKIIYLIHGWSETIFTSTWLLMAINAWVVTRNNPVVVIDWSKGNKYYLQTTANVRTIGKVVGESILKWGIIDRSVVVGHSCGAQVVGEAGKYIKSKGYLLPNCVGLDPAGPIFDGASIDIRLSKDDCALVKVMHSSSANMPIPAGVVDRKFGTFYKSGHCDIWINCGKSQGNNCHEPRFDEVMNPDGSQNNQTSEGSFCAHHRAPLVYVSQVNRLCNFQAEYCFDCKHIRGNSCRSSPASGRIRSLPDDDNCGLFGEVDYNLKTTDAYPYC